MFEKQMRTNAGVIELSQSAEKRNLTFLVPLVCHFHTAIKTKRPNLKKNNVKKAQLNLISWLELTGAAIKVIPQYCIAHPYCARFLRY